MSDLPITRGGASFDAPMSAQVFGPATELFLRMIGQEETLVQEARERALKHFDEVDRFFRRLALRYAPQSRDLLMELRTGHPKPDVRRDGTSSYDHEMTQALMVIWQYENRVTVRRYVRSAKRLNGAKAWPEFLRNTNPEWEAKRRKNFLYKSLKEVDLALAIRMNHDSVEDLELDPDTLFRRLMRASRPHRKDAKCICDCIADITKEDKNEPVEIWGMRAGRTAMSLAAKYDDRMTNLATMIGSHRTEEDIRAYVAETKIFIRMHPEKVLTNGTLSYMAEYLDDQCNLLDLYLDFKEAAPEDKNAFLYRVEQAIEEALADYGAESIDSYIHPMMGISRRIFNDPEVLAVMGNQPLLIPVPVAELSAPLGADPLRPAPP